MKAGFLPIALLTLTSPGFAQQVLTICSSQNPCPGLATGTVQAFIDQNGWRNFKLTLTQNVTSFSFVGTPPPTQAAVNVIFTEDATGGRTVTFAPSITNPCTITTTANATTLCQFEYDGTAATWLGISGAAGGGFSGGTECSNNGLGTQVPFLNVVDGSSVVHNTACYDSNAILYFTRRPNGTLPGFDAAAEFFNLGNYTTNITNKRVIGALGLAETASTETGNILALIDFDAFGPIHAGTGTITTVIGFNAEMSFGTYPAATVGNIVALEAGGPSSVYTGTGQTTGLVIDGGFIHTQGLNIGIDFLTPSFAGANDLAIRQNSNTMKNKLGRVQIADQGTCTMAAGTCSAQTLASGTYNAAPNCFLTWNGSGTLTGILKAPSTTTTVTPASTVNTDTAVVNWACLGN